MPAFKLEKLPIGSQAVKPTAPREVAAPGSVAPNSAVDKMVPVDLWDDMVAFIEARVPPPGDTGPDEPARKLFERIVRVA